MLRMLIVLPQRGQGRVVGELSCTPDSYPVCLLVMHQSHQNPGVSRVTVVCHGWVKWE
jgi:hypothetical protein